MSREGIFVTELYKRKSRTTGPCVIPLEHKVTTGPCNIQLKHNVTSDIPKLKKPTKENVKNWAKNGSKKQSSKNPSIKIGHAGASASGLVDMIDTFDCPGKAEANSTYARAGSYAHFSNKPGERIPKAGLYAEAGVGEAKAEFSIFGAYAKGPNAGAGLNASLTGVGAMATAGLGQASANAGPFSATVGLQLDTGITAGLDGISAHILGIGFSIGPKTSISFLGNSVGFDLV